MVVPQATSRSLVGAAVLKVRFGCATPLSETEMVLLAMVESNDLTSKEMLVTLASRYIEPFVGWRFTTVGGTCGMAICIRL